MDRRGAPSPSHGMGRNVDLGARVRGPQRIDPPLGLRLLAAVGVVLGFVGSGCASTVQNAATDSPRSVATSSPPTPGGGPPQTATANPSSASPLAWTIVSSPSPSGGQGSALHSAP
jgi:hypothetical protein